MGAIANSSDGASPGDWFHVIVEAAPNAMIVVAGDGTIAFVNRGAEALFGYARSELIGQPIERLVPARSRAQHGALRDAFGRTPAVRAMGAGRELFGLHKDGREVPIEIGLNPVEIAGARFTIASIIDITERKAHEGWLRLVVEAVPSAIVVTDRTGTIVLVNRQAEALFGHPRRELIGSSLGVLLPARYVGSHQHFIERYHHEPATRPMVGRELIARRRDGTEISVEIGLAPLETPDGTLTMASIVDVSERRRNELELRRSNAELEQFAYIASHDLQEPLRMVASFTELLAQRYQGQLDERADKYIHFAVDGAKRMQRLVADLLAYSRVGSQGRPLTPVDATTVVAEVIQVLGPAIRAADATIEVGPLPVVQADETQLRQLFQNLLGNGLKFRGPERPVLRVDATYKEDRWQFSVADNGIGIDMKYADRIFQMFQRLHERGKYEGSGIGLTIAKRIVERHGGAIWLESAPDRGTTFFFTLLPPGPR